MSNNNLEEVIETVEGAGKGKKILNRAGVLGLLACAAFGAYGLVRQGLVVVRSFIAIRKAAKVVDCKVETDETEG